MLKLTRYKDASSNYVALHVTKHLGVKASWDMDGNRTKGLHFLIWYGIKRLSYKDLWLPLIAAK
jgi:hypothetical protein